MGVFADEKHRFLLNLYLSNTDTKSPRSVVITIEQDTNNQSLDGKVLLNAMLVEQGKLLQKLEKLVKAHQGNSNLEKITEFPFVRAQILLCE